MENTTTPKPIAVTDSIFTDPALHDFRGLSGDLSVEAVVQSLLDEPATNSYTAPASRLKAIFDRISLQYSRDAAAHFSKLILIALIENRDQIKSLRLTDELNEMMKLEHHRILEEMKTNPPEYYTECTDLYMKDLGLCTQKLIYAGAQILEPRFRFPLSILFAEGFFKAIPKIYQFIRRGTAHYPYLETHTSDRHLKEFTPEGWERCFHRIVKVLELNPELKGMLGSSWFYDPAIVEVSPRLAYLHEKQVLNGGQFFFVSHDQDSFDLATKTSASRRELVQAGRYKPAKYLIVWDRKSMFNWAARASV